MRNPTLFLLLTTILAGCATPPPPKETTIPSSEAPQQATIPTRWKSPAPEGASSTSTQWWKAFNDPVLDGLVTQALSGNPDLAYAESHLKQVRSAVSKADAKEQATAAAELLAAENDFVVVRQSVTHTVTLAYADAQIAKRRIEILHRRMLLARELTARDYKLLTAGLIDTARLREDDQAEIGIRQTKARTRSEYSQACAKLALLLGMAPVEFSLAPGREILDIPLQLAVDVPDAVIERRPDVQAAWQRLLAATAATDQDDDLPLAARIDQAGNGSSERNALYRKTVLTALQEVEASLTAWKVSGIDLQTATATLQTNTAQVHAVERRLAAGRTSRIELLKAQLAENLAQEQVLAAKHARMTAYATAQLALARD